MIGKFLDTQEKFIAAQKAYSDKYEEIENKLIHKANNEKTGIKHIFYIPTYTKKYIKEDIQEIKKDSYNKLGENQITDHRNLLREEPKESIGAPSSFNLSYSTIVVNAKQLIEKRIQTSAPIQELLDDHTLAAWVQHGMEHHKE